MITYDHMPDFIRESNRIEGIYRDPYSDELDAAHGFIGVDDIAVGDMKDIVTTFTGGTAVLRDINSLNVRVGDYYPPPGGPEIREKLAALLVQAEQNWHPYDVHFAYENLHPFTDGNGRSGRLLWLWMMLRQGLPLAAEGFLHTWYYQSLAAGTRG